MFYLFCSSALDHRRHKRCRTHRDWVCKQRILLRIVDFILEKFHEIQSTFDIMNLNKSYFSEHNRSNLVFSPDDNKVYSNSRTWNGKCTARCHETTTSDSWKFLFNLPWYYLDCSMIVYVYRCRSKNVFYQTRGIRNRARERNGGGIQTDWKWLIWRENFLSICFVHFEVRPMAMNTRKPFCLCYWLHPSKYRSFIFV